MKSKIVMIIMVLSIILVACLAIFGLKIGNFKILSVSQMIDLNNEINSKIDKATKLASEDYPATVSKLETTTDTLKVQKEKYEQIAGFADEDDKSAYETEKYDIGYLWTTLGKLATKCKIGLTMDVKKSSGTEMYDLNFAVTGEYTDISTFITKLENSSNLSFRIYDFQMVSGKATFTVKDVRIDESTLIKKSSGITDNMGIGNNTDTNSLNTINK